MSNSANFDSPDRLVEIGVMGRPHGVRGELRIFLHNAESDFLVSANQVMLKTTKGVQTYTITDVRPNPKFYIVRLIGVNTREQAELLKGAKLCVDRGTLPEPDSDEFYVTDLVGLEAWDREQPLGRVAGSRRQEDVEIVIIRGEREEVEVPLVDDFVSQIDFPNRRLLLRDTEDLPRSKIRRGR